MLDFKTHFQSSHSPLDINPHYWYLEEAVWLFSVTSPHSEVTIEDNIYDTEVACYMNSLQAFGLFNANK